MAANQHNNDNTLTNTTTTTTTTNTVDEHDPFSHLGLSSSSFKSTPSTPASSRSSASLKRPREHTESAAKRRIETTANSPPSSPPSSSGLVSFNSSDLCCVVCLDLPPSGVLQCSHGHILCAQDWKRIVDSQRAVCPVCRVKLNRDHPIKNRFAESLLSSYLIPCPHRSLGCHEQVKFGQQIQHTRSECEYRQVKCSFYLLGCDWCGLALDRSRHIAGCRFHGLSSSDLLRPAYARHQQLIKAARREGEAVECQAHVCRLLTKRVRDISIRDVFIQKDDFCGDRCSRTFKAVGLNVQVVVEEADRIKEILNNPGDELINGDLKDADRGSSGWLRVHVKVVSPLKKRTTIEVFIMPAGALMTSTDFRVAIRRILFSPRCTVSESFPLPLSNADALTAVRSESINLRIGFIDVSRGPVKAEFTTLPVLFHDSSSDSEAASQSEAEVDGVTSEDEEIQQQAEDIP